jgi:hypothetical protein
MLEGDMVIVVKGHVIRAIAQLDPARRTAMLLAVAGEAPRLIRVAFHWGWLGPRHMTPGDHLLLWREVAGQWGDADPDMMELAVENDQVDLQLIAGLATPPSQSASQALGVLQAFLPFAPEFWGGQGRALAATAVASLPTADKQWSEAARSFVWAWVRNAPPGKELLPGESGVVVGMMAALRRSIAGLPDSGEGLEGELAQLQEGLGEYLDLLCHCGLSGEAERLGEAFAKLCNGGP